MSTDRLLCAALFAALALPAAAQAPLSAIEWLDSARNTQIVAPPRPRAQREEPPVARSGTRPDVETMELGAPSPEAVGLLPMSVTGLPPDLWARSRVTDLVPIMGSVEPAVPAMSALLFTLLLAEGDPPVGSRDGAPFLAARLDRLFDEGAIDPGLAMLDRAGGAATPGLFRRWMDFALLSGTDEAPCRALKADPSLSDDLPTRIYCDARTGDWDHAVTVLGTARALGQLDARDAELLARFLDPALTDGATPLSAPVRPTPLEFRLFEAIGEALPTQPLPRPFAAADLSGTSGWRAQILAAERLARVGALSDNRLLGIYTDRQPAASGGVWDRVAAIQALEEAVETDRPDLAGPALVKAWPQMRSANLLVPFSQLFGPRLSGIELTGRAADLAARAALLSANYETASNRIEPSSELLRVATAIARGARPAEVPEGPRAEAALAAWTGEAEVPPALDTLLEERRLGETILRAMELFRSGAEGNHSDLTGALATFRRVGLEDAARRAAIQYLLLSDEGSLR